MAEQIANLTTHQNLTDAIITTMGESLAFQQALMQRICAGNSKGKAREYWEYCWIELLLETARR